MNVGWTYHGGMSVDCDRFSDTYMRKRICAFFAKDGVTPTPDEVRRKCREARSKGQVVFVACDRPGPDGACAGHEPEQLGVLVQEAKHKAHSDYLVLEDQQTGNEPG